jgi:DNA-binding beta-propeller fold protein YncE
VAAGTNPFSVTIDPSGQFAYVANVSSNNISVYTVGSDGSLTPGTAVAAGTNPYSVTVDPSGKFAYTTNVGDNTVSGYTIQGNGALISTGAAVPFE